MRANVEFLRENFGMNDTIFEECRLAGAGGGALSVDEA